MIPRPHPMASWPLAVLLVAALIALVVGLFAVTPGQDDEPCPPGYRLHRSSGGFHCDAP